MEDVKISKKKFTFLFIIIILIILSLITVNATGNMTNKNDNTTSSFKTNVNEINHEKIQQTHEIKDDKKLKTTKKDNTKESLEITANNIDTYVDDEITVIYDTNKPIDDGIMTYYIDNNRIGIQNLSDEKDYFTYNITEYKVGVHNLRIDYAGSEKYTNTYTTLTLTISKYSTQIEDLKIEFNQENNIDISFKLRSQNNYINTGSIILYNETTPITQKICEPDIKITL